VLLLEQGPPGLFRGWLGTEEIEGSSDLAALEIPAAKCMTPAWTTAT